MIPSMNGSCPRFVINIILLIIIFIKYISALELIILKILHFRTIRLSLNLQ